MIGLCFGGLVGVVAGWLASLIARRRDPLPDQWLASAVGDAGAGTFDPPRVVPPTFPRRVMLADGSTRFVASFSEEERLADMAYDAIEARVEAEGR